MKKKKIYKIKSVGYTIYIGDNFLYNFDQLLKQHISNKTKVFALVDENSQQYCLKKILKQSSIIANAIIIQINSGEINKNISTCEHIWKALIKNGADRNSILLNIGGGVISDIGGFAASTYKRGIKFINIPTTLLAQVDASVGGKTGIDFGGLKNEIGTFSAPECVIIDTSFIETLPVREVISAYAEIVKHGLIADKKYVLEIANMFFGSNSNINTAKIVRKSVEIKNNIVKKDFSEQSIRKSLNFGHTIGHAIESYLLKKTAPLLHGEAIAIGMICEAHISFRMKLLKKDELDFITNLIIHIFGYFKINKFDVAALVELMKHDKKNSNNKISFTLLNGMGKTKLNQTCDLNIVKSALLYFQKNAV